MELKVSEESNLNPIELTDLWAVVGLGVVVVDVVVLVVVGVVVESRSRWGSRSLCWWSRGKIHIGWWNFGCDCWWSCRCRSGRCCYVESLCTTCQNVSLVLI